jgi:hypothetical protein
MSLVNIEILFLRFYCFNVNIQKYKEIIFNSDLQI